MTGTLVDVVNRLDEVDDSNPYDPLVIYAKGGPDAMPDACALICPGDDRDSLICPLDESLSEVLMVQLAQEAIEAWSAWRNGQVPEPQDKFEAVMYYLRHDAYLPVDGDA